MYLPAITPFVDDEVDLDSYVGLIEHYVRAGVAGVIPLGTTGESPAITPDERDRIVDATVQTVAGRAPVYVGVSGNVTRSVVETIHHLERFDVAGYLVVCPYYNRPPQDGILAHFERVASSTSRSIIVYNIPYRTGINIENDTLLALADSCRNVVAVKDSSGSLAQTADLLARAGDRLAVLTGEDNQFFTVLANGAAGGILAAAHVATETFVGVERRIRENDVESARREWKLLAPIVSMLFAEPNPMPLKHCLWRMGLIRSPQCRLPLTQVSPGLAGALDDLLATKVAQPSPSD
ncbi:MAG TPA: 4-hydroxy-tetrahydrodipicolinate synthase [Actinomycetota bacterium]|nr:4-hydroxy-tetrahydrodipicolinate synthase [Actinomycetota bacterium]